MASVRTPLSTQVPIVDEHGNPTPFFQRLMQVLLEEKAITDTNADDALAGLLAKADKTITISAGTGLTGGGDLSANRILALDIPAEAERIRDVIGTALVAGSNITITVNDAGDTITIAASGGGGGGGAWTPIAQTLLTVAAATIDFTSIPATYEDLVIVLQGRGTTAAVSTNMLMRFNNDSGANYDFSRWNRFGNNSNVAQTSAEIGSLMAATAPAGNSSQATIEINNYARTTLRKTAFTLQGGDESTLAAGQYSHISNMLWRSTAAINRVTILLAAGNFDIGTVATLYGRSSTIPTTTPLIGEVVAVGGESALTVSSIPTTYRELLVTCQYRGSVTADGIMRFNNDSSAIYNRHRQYGGTTNSADSVSNQTSFTFLGSVNSATNAATFAQFEGLISNYKDTAKYKTMTGIGSQFDSDTAGYNLSHTCIWKSTAAINRIDLLLSAGTFVAGSTIRVFGRA